jgi:hypothetical protein
MLADPAWVIGIIVGATVIGGLLMWWTTKPSGK